MELTQRNSLEILEWCKKQFGTRSPHANRTPQLKYVPYRLGDKGEIQSAYGAYCDVTNTIWIYYASIKEKNPITALYKGILTIIHEYRHYQQDLTEYDNLSHIFGYQHNPLEVEARMVAELYATKCYTDLFSCE